MDDGLCIFFVLEIANMREDLWTGTDICGGFTTKKGSNTASSKGSLQFTSFSLPNVVADHPIIEALAHWDFTKQNQTPMSEGLRVQGKIK